jgi:hypothetical protein
MSIIGFGGKMSITENKKFSPRFLTGNMIKIIAAAFMVMDHIGVILMHEDGILRILGRISMPLFAYMIAEGAKYTKNKTKYLGMIAGLAAICQLVYYFALNDTYMCILVTFSLSIALIYALDFLKWAYLSGKGGTMAKIFSPLLFFGLTGLVYYLTTILMIDYGFFGIMMPVFASITDMRGYEIPEKARWIERHYVRVGLMMIPMLLRMVDNESIMWYSFLAIPVLLLYSEKRGKWKMKYFFYIFYPLHLVLIFVFYLLFTLL